MDSRAQSAASGVQGQAQGQQASAGGQRNRIVEVDNGQERHDEPPEDYYIADLYQQLSSVIIAKPTEIEPLRIGINYTLYVLAVFLIFFLSDDAEDPACVPMLWVSKWVDYSDKYGLGYQLCDESVGVLFNDSTRLILCSSGESVL